MCNLNLVIMLILASVMFGRREEDGVESGLRGLDDRLSGRDVASRFRDLSSLSLGLGW